MWASFRTVMLLVMFGTGVACRQAVSPGTSQSPFTMSAEDLNRPLPSPLPEEAARVNEQPIPMRGVAVLVRQMARGHVPDDRRSRLVREAANQLVIRELLYQEAQARRLAPDQKAVRQAYDEARVGYRDDPAWESYLEGKGLDSQMFQAELLVKFTIQALFDQETASVSSGVTEEEAKAFYAANPSLFETGERVRARHILYRVPKDMEAGRKGELRTRLEKLLLRIRGGEDLAKLAREHSEDSTSKQKGGELPVLIRGQRDPAFEKAVFALKPGQVSDVVETPGGFHIIQLEERLASVKLDFEEVVPVIQKRIVERRRERHLEDLVQKLKAQAKIEYFL